MEKQNIYCSVRLFSDERIRLSFYHKSGKPQFKQYDDWNKVHKETGELVPYELTDALKRMKSGAISLARTRKIVRELSCFNRFYYFLTITFNRKYVDASDAKAVHRKFRAIIKRLKRAYDGVEYIQVAEFHKDCEFIHYHLMINFGVAPKLKYKGLSDKGQRVYTLNTAFVNFNRSDCFLTFEKLSEKNNVDYLLKYITKGFDHPLTRRFGCTRGLIRTRVQERFSRSFDFCSASTVKLANTCSFRRVVKSPKCVSLEYEYNLARGDDTYLRSSSGFDVDYACRRKGKLSRNARQLTLDLSNIYIKGDDRLYVYQRIVAILKSTDKILKWASSSNVDILEKIAKMFAA